MSEKEEKYCPDCGRDLAQKMYTEDEYHEARDRAFEDGKEFQEFLDGFKIEHLKIMFVAVLIMSSMWIGFICYYWGYDVGHNAGLPQEHGNFYIAIPGGSTGYAEIYREWDVNGTIERTLLGTVEFNDTRRIYLTNFSMAMYEGSQNGAYIVANDRLGFQYYPMYVNWEMPSSHDDIPDDGYVFIEEHPLQCDGNSVFPIEDKAIAEAELMKVSYGARVTTGESHNSMYFVFTVGVTNEWPGCLGWIWEDMEGYEHNGIVLTIDVLNIDENTSTFSTFLFFPLGSGSFLEASINVPRDVNCTYSIQFNLYDTARYLDGDFVDVQGHYVNVFWEYYL